MTNSELDPKNYKRISITNWVLLVPLLILFAWPYLYLARYIQIPDYLTYSGAALFAIPFALTILHGHVTMAVGKTHRTHYYQWLEAKAFSYGFLFHRMMMRTRFRLALLILSALIFIIGYILSI